MPDGKAPPPDDDDLLTALEMDMYGNRIYGHTFPGAETVTAGFRVGNMISGCFPGAYGGLQEDKVQYRRNIVRLARLRGMTLERGKLVNHVPRWERPKIKTSWTEFLALY